MTAISHPSRPISQQGHVRPVNLRTDLGQLADLIELVFAPTMDENGRAAIREMRAMSRLGAGLNVLTRLNELAQGISLGYVWEVDGRVVGNVSIYPADSKFAEKSWIIANVGVHPDYQRRGIARRLMKVSLDMIAEKGGRSVILQVEHDNHGAIHLYEQLGFVRERAFTTWTRSSLVPAPAAPDTDYFITRRRPSEWRKEMAFVGRLRPAAHGGIGWQKPLTKDAFHLSLWQQITRWVSLNTTERLVVHDEHSGDFLAVLWIQNQLTGTRTKLTLFADAHQPDAANALLVNALRRFSTASLQIEHPHDDETGNHLLARHRFNAKRTLWHMRYDVPPR